MLCASPLPLFMASSSHSGVPAWSNKHSSTDVAGSLFRAKLMPVAVLLGPRGLSAPACTPQVLMSGFVQLGAATHTGASARAHAGACAHIAAPGVSPLAGLSAPEGADFESGSATLLHATQPRFCATAAHSWRWELLPLVVTGKALGVCSGLMTRRCTWGLMRV